MNFLKRRGGSKKSTDKDDHQEDGDGGKSSESKINNDLKKSKSIIGKALIVGGGPAGALAAKTLADHNYEVTLCESYPHPTGSLEKNHAYVISINPRGIRALRRVGIDPLSSDLMDGGVPTYTYVRHGTKPNSKAKIIHKTEPSVIIRRQKLTANLLRLAEQAGATIICGEELMDVDFDKRVATFISTNKTTNDKEVKRSYDLLVGADGVKSITRSLLESRGLLEKPTREEPDDMEYQVAVLPRHWKKTLSPTAAAVIVDAVPDVSVHTYANRKTNTNVLVFPLHDGGSSLVCVISPGGQLGQLKIDKSSYGPFLKSLFSNWSDESRSELATQLAAVDNVPTTGGTCIWTSALGLPQSGVVLVGDSGHGMWPSLGQGCNAALESVSVLADAVEAIVYGTSSGAGIHAVDVWGDNMTSIERSRLVAEEYQGLRHEDCLAIVDLTFGGIGNRRVRGQQNGKVMFLLQTTLMMLLHRITLKLVPMPALLRVMMGDDVPYSTLLWQHKCENMMTYAFLVAMVVAIAIYLLKVT